ncbi:MAG TPA: FtsX-like permease family protein, partial [Opitutaceae bacterium]|nr:FtsX-like permease family protein [Opitutaceae bacterium]
LPRPSAVSPNLQIAFRFLTAKKRAMLMSLACIVLGVGLFIVTQATTSGFEGFFIKTILGANGAIRIEDEIQATIRSMAAGGEDSSSNFQVLEKEGRKYIQGIQQPELIMDALRHFSNVAGVAEVLHGDVIINSSFKNDSAQVYGINLEDYLKVSDLGGHIVQGSLEEFRNEPDEGALMGRILAEREQLNVGDSFILQVHNQIRRYRVAAIYETGVRDIDQVRVYIHLSEARSLLEKPTGASFIQVNLYDELRAPQDALQMERTLHHSAAPWQEREKEWLEVFGALRKSTAITVSVFTLIAALAMFNTLAMIVLEKTKDIAILRSMGYTRQDISRIFLWQAAIVLAIGTVIGCLFGAGVTYAISQIPLRIRTIFTTDTFVVAWSVWHYIEATLTAVVMVMVASLIPARRAARLEPGDIIRGTAL